MGAEVASIRLVSCVHCTSYDYPHDAEMEVVRLDRYGFPVL
jgi:hypothetical protein